MKEYITPDMKLIRSHVNDVLAASETPGFNPDAEQGGWDGGDIPLGID